MTQSPRNSVHDEAGRAPADHRAGAGFNPVHDLHARLQDTYAGRHLDKIDDRTPALACLKPLLCALDWAGEARHLEEALPHFDEVRELDDLRALLARLNFHTEPRTARLDEVLPGMTPALFEAEGTGAIFVVLDIEADGRLLVFDGTQRAFRTLRPTRSGGTLFLVRPIDREKVTAGVRKYGWIQDLFRRFRRTILTLFLMTFVINVLALAVPIYTMNVYDKVIGAKSAMTLFYMLSGIALLVMLEFGLRGVRTNVIGFLGARFESLLSIGAFEKLLHLPAGMTETAPISSQMTRLRQFEGVRDIFTGALGNAILDLPFALVFLAAIFAIGGVVGFVPFALLVVFCILAGVSIPMTRLRVRRVGDAKQQERKFLMELTERRRTIRRNVAEDVWLERYKDLASTALVAQFKAQQLNVAQQAVSQALVMAAGVATIALGAIQVLAGELSVGALIAIVALVWRLLSPLQAVFLGLNSISSTLETFKQINSMMRLESERQPGELPTFEREFRGDITFVGVGFRYGRSMEPALRGVSLEIPRGQIVAIAGGSAAGKSTLLKLVAGLYPPQAGLLRVDGLDLRQMDMGELRHAIGYAPQIPQFYYGTIAQNLRLADPTVSESVMWRALDDAGIAAHVRALPDGLETRLKSVNRHKLPGGFMQQLTLARAYLKESPILLLDDPGSRLDQAGDEALVRKLHTLRGKTTVLLVTHRPSHMRAADRVIVLDQGTAVGDGPPDEIVPALLNQQPAA